MIPNAVKSPGHISLTTNTTMPPKAVATPSATPSTSRIRSPAAKWSNDEVSSLVLQLKEAKDERNTSEKGFKSRVWSSIAGSFSD